VQRQCAVGRIFSRHVNDLNRCVARRQAAGCGLPASDPNVTELLRNTPSPWQAEPPRSEPL
jgi:hypothetical protein